MGLGFSAVAGVRRPLEIDSTKPSAKITSKSIISFPRNDSSFHPDATISNENYDLNREATGRPALFIRLLESVIDTIRS
jgi:hypothetical protein